MTKREALKQLSGLPHPIINGLVVFDDGCEFYILTHQKGFACLVGGAFPINGPLKLSPAQYMDFSRVFSLHGGDSLEEAISEHIYNEIRRDFLIHLLKVIGEDAIKEILRINWPLGKAFYVFHDMGRSESAMFPSLKAAYEYFLSYFMEQEGGISWQSMSKDELIEWIECVECWRAEGSKKLPPRDWLGAYYG